MRIRIFRGEALHFPGQFLEGFVQILIQFRQRFFQRWRSGGQGDGLLGGIGLEEADKFFGRFL
ncbi:hypothetical protein REC12_23595 [Desulfosporosinus sp. PR]|nr:hypothetical protein [Desulfosporosinus sp. PR]